MTENKEKKIKEQEVKTEEPKKEEKKENEKKVETVSKEEYDKVKAELEKIKAEKEDVTRKWYSVSAEYDNYRKRTANTASQKYLEGKADIVLKIFPIGDNIERALAVCCDDKMKQGLEMIKKSFDKTLSEEGIEAFDPTGEVFDSKIANALMAVQAEEGEKAGTVKQTYAKGYRRGDKILRFAQVVVINEN